MVDSINGVNTGATATTNSTGTSGTSSVGSDYLTFLRMLTTQVQNQDPLNPMESSDFAVQLATFSGVEQQVQTNNLLTELLNANGGQLAQYSGWIGREIRASGPIWYEGESVTLQIDSPANADQLILITSDSAGNEIMREDIGTGSGEVDWQGRDASGNALPDGHYQFQLLAMNNGEVISTTNVEGYSEVTGIEISTEGPVLVLRGNGAVLVDHVTGIREAAEQG
ncbi:flagellar hook capping FlgD N-terminal domain-containing protein [Paracoccus aestuariivivens]|uniref:Basal-body rod modification protein FlgD n=1 Tax=Paracoccus aestuariivivens TaxID=1820333 RepID=A0A6L6J7Y9_9RHOB|nr:flagellar hook capping FlgD N-terminal domain-containing protein [Paracoccus aestuariivivens]MTH76111.1 flagellar basal body rod modification protein [Paracoccus aestuariivivens]